MAVIPSKKAYMTNPEKYKDLEQDLIRNEYSILTLGLVHLLVHCAAHRKLKLERNTSSLLLQGLLVSRCKRDELLAAIYVELDAMEASVCGEMPTHGRCCHVMHIVSKAPEKMDNVAAGVVQKLTEMMVLMGCLAVKAWMIKMLNIVANNIENSIDEDDLNKNITQHHKPDHAWKRMRVDEDYKAAVVKEAGSGPVSSCSRLVVAKGHGQHQQSAKHWPSELVQARLLAMRRHGQQWLCERGL